MSRKHPPQRADSPNRNRQGSRPLHPHLVLAAAVILPGLGQLLNHMATRALMMVFFMVMLGWVTYHLTPPERSFVGRHAGGIFVYAMSILDAYKWARYRWVYFEHHGSTPPPPR